MKRKPKDSTIQKWSVLPFYAGWIGRKVVFHPLTGDVPHRIVDIVCDAHGYFALCLEGGNVIDLSTPADYKLGHKIWLLIDREEVNGSTKPQLIPTGLFAAGGK